MKNNNDNFRKMYRYLGYSSPDVPDGWKPIVKEMIVNIDRMVRPWYMPRFVLNWLSDLATGGSVVRIKNIYLYSVLRYFIKHNKITTIKDKYAGLRVYGYFDNKVDDYVESIIDMCEGICENCGSKIDVKVCVRNGWDYNYCSKCREECKCNEV